MQKKKGIFGNLNNITTMFCLGFSDLDKEVVYAGTLQGQVLIWKGTELKEIIPGVHTSSIFQISKFNNGFCTAGKDGIVRTWDANFAPLITINLKELVSHLKSPEFYFKHGQNLLKILFFQEEGIYIYHQKSLLRPFKIYLPQRLQKNFLFLNTPHKYKINN